MPLKDDLVEITGLLRVEASEREVVNLCGAPHKVDDFGYDPFTPAQTSQLFRVVGARHRNGSVVLTAKTGFSRWKTLFPSEAIAVATVDRLVDDATILRFTGTTFRNPREVVGAPLDE